MALSAGQQDDAARQWEQRVWVSAGITAVLGHDEIVANVANIDAWLDNALSSVAASPGNTSATPLINSGNNALTANAKANLTLAQKTVLLSYVLMKRAGII